MKNFLLWPMREYAKCNGQEQSFVVMTTILTVLALGTIVGLGMDGYHIARWYAARQEQKVTCHTTQKTPWDKEETCTKVAEPAVKQESTITATASAKERAQGRLDF
jgi:hypothetical protein